MRDITSEADEEDETDTETEFQKAKTIGPVGEAEKSLRPIEEVRKERKKGAVPGQRWRQIIAEINFGRKILDRIASG